MLVWSASCPSKAAPRPAIPKANPKNRPEISPTRPGTSSCANTRIAENADARINPMMTLSTPVQKRFAYGAADDRPRGHGAEECEQVELRRLHREPELPHEEERVEVAQAREVEVLREHQDHEDRERAAQACPGNARRLFRAGRASRDG